jgi:hypothetical protein
MTIFFLREGTYTTWGAIVGVSGKGRTQIFSVEWKFGGSEKKLMACKPVVHAAECK